MLTEVKMIRLESVGSTNTYAKEHWRELADGTLVTAEEQTAGRGRLGRKWESPKGVNVYGSFLMKGEELPGGGEAFTATLVSSMSILETLRSFAPGRTFYIKWPNDVYYREKKIAGVLSEGVLDQTGRVKAVIAGMGINVNMSGEMLSRIDRAATSLREVTGKEIPLKNFEKKLAETLKTCYIFRFTRQTEFRASWKAENLLLGRTLEFTEPCGRVFLAKMLDIKETGELVLEMDGGVTREFSCGDLRIERSSIETVYKNEIEIERNTNN